MNELAFMCSFELQERDCITPGKPGKENDSIFKICQDPCIHRIYFHSIHAVH